jgi:hypothetical protein
MRPDTLSGRDEDFADAYWRRRAYVLTGVLLTAGLLMWACSGDEKDTRQVRAAGAASTPTPSVTPSAALFPAVLPTVTVTATARVTVTPAVPRRPGDACDPKSVVIALEGGKTVYAAGEAPQFRLTAVNTGAVPCTFDVGAGRLEVRITSGADRIWSSADCVSGTGSSIQMLRRGIPYVGTVVWDRRRSAPKCAGARSPAREGTYVATLRGGGTKIRRQVFHLR